MIPLLAALALLAAGARAEAPPAAAPPPFAAHPARCEADLLLDVGAPSGDVEVAWAAVVGPRIPGAVLLLPGLSASGPEVDLASLVAAGCVLGLAPEPPPEGGRPSVRSMLAQARADRRALHRAGGARVTAASMAGDSPLQEAVLAVLGLDLLLPPEGRSPGLPRFSQGTQGALPSSVVLPAPALTLPAGLDPASALVARLDAAAEALESAQVPVVRLTLDGPALAADGYATLERWRREVMQPCGARLLTPQEASRTLRAWLQRGGARALAAAASTAATPTATPALGQLDEVTVYAAAASLSCGHGAGAALPRTLPSGLNLTDAFQAFTLLLAQGGGPVALSPLRPPQSSPRSVLGAEGVALSAAVVRTAAAELAPGLRDQVPAFMRVGETALTAAELLCAMGRVVRGEDPVELTAVYSPDPFAAGLGWDQEIQEILTP